MKIDRAFRYRQWQELHRQHPDWTNAQYARAMGVTQSYISDLRIDPLGKRADARREKTKGVCVDCGAVTSRGANGKSNRCMSCFRRFRSENPKWTREKIIAAVQMWAETHGKPPTATDWHHGNDGYPGAGVVYGAKGPFPKWADAIEAAGFPRPWRGHKTKKRDYTEWVGFGKESDPNVRWKRS